MSQIGVPTADWRGESGLVANTADDSLARLVLAQWNVTEQARYWYTYPDYQNYGLLVKGFDESGGFLNNSVCQSELSNIQLQVDFVANDPAPPPPPPLPTVPPLPPSLRETHVAPQFSPMADLLVSKVDVTGKGAKTANSCLAGDNVVTATIKNDGGASAVDADYSLDAQIPQIVVALRIDGKERVRTVTFLLHAAEERTVAFEAIKLTKGTHALQVVIDPDNRVSESDKTNNSFTQNKVVCK